jgi:hypothetical protein
MLCFSVIACVAADARVPPAAPPVVELPPPPVVAPAPVPREVALAAEILRVGAEAVTDEWTDGDGAWQDNVFFRELRRFLESRTATPAVQAGCSRWFGYDVELVPDLMQAPAHDERAAVSLAALVQVRAPRDVAQQWECLTGLRERHGDDPAWSDLLRELSAPFAPAAIDAALRAEPPTADTYINTTMLEWAVRAAGVTRHAGAMPRLVELATNGDFRVSPAAELSLADFPGTDAAEVRAKRRREDGLLFARFGSSASVPHLCATVGRTDVVDGEMFDAIARLATAEQLPLVDALPSSVRDEQRERAKSVVDAVHARLGR